MVPLFLLFLYRIQVSLCQLTCTGAEDCTINCDTPQQCKGLIIDCADGYNCDFICNGNQTCYGLTINCNSAIDCKNLTITCDGTATDQTCNGLIVNGHNADMVTFTARCGGLTDDTKCATTTTINCPQNPLYQGICNVNCETGTSCYNMALYGHFSESVTFVAKGQISRVDNLFEMALYCPNSKNCVVQGDTGGVSLNGLTIHTPNPSDFSYVNIQCIGGGTCFHHNGLSLNCVADTCQVDPVTLDSCDGDNLATSCDVRMSYVLGPDKRNWTAAEDYCAATYTGGHLASIRGAAELSAFQPVTNDHKVWIGLNDRQTQDIWLWSDASQCISNDCKTYTYWKTNEPNLLIDHHCVTHMNSQNYWEDNACQDNYDFVCNTLPRTPGYVPTTTNPTTYTPTTTQPTTYMPTTNIPTTFGPTTSAPTTVNPTTFSPTTVEPTTTAPTTITPTTNAPTTANPTTNMPTTNAPTTAQPTTSQPTTFNPTTKSPITSAPAIITTNSGDKTDLTISFEIDEDVSEKDINDLIIGSLTAYDDVKIISTVINQGKVEVVIQLEGQVKEDDIEGLIEDELEDEYGKDIDVDVKNNDSLNNENDNFFDQNFFVILMALIIGILYIICILCIIYIGNKKRLQNKPENDMNRISSLSDNINACSPMNTTEMVGTNTASNGGGGKGEYNDPYSDSNALHMWLNNVGLSEYYELFIDEGFGDKMSALSTLTEDDLKEIGITKMAHRKVIIEQIERNNNFEGYGNMQQQHVVSGNNGEFENDNENEDTPSDRNEDLFIPSHNMTETKGNNMTLNGMNDNDSNDNLDEDEDDDEDDALYQKSSVITSGQ